MSNQEIHATVRGSVESFQQMIEEMALDGETEHSDLYLNILEDEVQVLQQAPGEVVLTFGSYNDEFFDEINLEVDVTEETAMDKQGNELAFRAGAEAILHADDTLTYLDFASEGGTVELEFTGSTENRLATYVRANGALEAWVKLSGSEDILQDVPHWLRFRYTDDNVYTSPTGSEAPCIIQTNVSKVSTNISAVKEDRDADYYPITVQDGEFLIDIGDEDRSGVSGTLGAQSISIPDGMEVENYYFDGFEEIFRVLDGPIELQTGPGNNPMAVVQKGSDGRVVRHVNGTVEQ